ncbi:hypothetical protein G3570_10250 [Balneolaceae bacterium YR4-1]|uniref:Uncharacterized protein n=1 Tax=Halalkalibaculum roseum TaxID=2709311 RepID=A0A6M1T4U9_9BACT|nr:hypothetical protein [Halalkalibaculum roseum]NGP77015.1 hypothetical protein [Halalkalibaculum roseum]
MKNTLKRGKSTLLFCLMLPLVLLAAACTSEHTYTGRVIEIDFRNIDEIKDEAWIEVDGVRYTHYQNFMKSKQDAYSLPASKEVYYIVKKDSSREQRYKPVNDFSIAIRLGNSIDLAHTRKDTTLARVKINERYRMLAFGTLILQRPDSTAFTVKTSSEYPAKITVEVP